MSEGKRKPGNPGGRPRIADNVKRLARKHSEKAVHMLVKLIDSEDERTALAASNALLDRAVGKPAQAVTGEDGEGPAKLVITWQSEE